jgi:hypothetical protein
MSYDPITLGTELSLPVDWTGELLHVEYVGF